LVSADVLAALRAVPVGGVRGPNGNDLPVLADRVNLPGSDSGSLAVRQILLAQTLPGHIFVQSPEAAPKEGQPPASSSSNAGMVFEESMRILDVLRRAVKDLANGTWAGWNLDGWLKGLRGSSLGPKAKPGENVPIDAATEDDEDDDDAPRATLQRSLNGTWLGVLPMLGLLVPMDAHRRRASQPKVEPHGEEDDRLAESA
jgi:hypothetical protein